MLKKDIVDKYFPVLDHGFVALKDFMGSDSSIVQAARVSYGKGTKATSDDRTLLRYLMRNKHTTPYEMVVFQFHISMPIHVHRQFIRHRMSTTNEYSARYSVVPEVTYENYDLNLQSKNNKQGRSEDQLLEEMIEVGLKDKVGDLRRDSFDLYNGMVEKGVAREIARMHLPLNTYTYFYWKIDLHNLCHFLKLRCDSHAQWEIRQFANTLAGFVKEVCPLSFEAWYDYAFQAVNFTRLDRLLFQKVPMFNGVPFGDWKTNIFLKEYSEEIGMSKREYDEFFDKLTVPQEQDFALDFSLAKSADFFEKV